MAGILTRKARIVTATHFKNSNLFMAFATGLVGWDALTPNPFPAYDIDQTDVTAAFAWKKILNKQYCTPDVAGEIITDNGRFAFSLEPTEHLFCKATLEPAEYSSSVIREFGVFYDTVTQVGLPDGQELFSPAQITAKGSLIMVRRKLAIQRTTTTRQLAEFVITF